MSDDTVEDEILLILRGLDPARVRRIADIEDVLHRPSDAAVGGVHARATVAEGLIDLQLDRSWLDKVSMDDVGQCVVAAVNAAEDEAG